jgi:hypothetical protein
VTAPNAPKEGSDAGDASGRNAEHVARRVRSYRSQANRYFRAAQIRQSRNAADASARQALDRAARAFWWAEDTPMEDEQHRLMHKIGRWTRRNLGCELDFVGSGYQLRCPIAIAHKRFGFSIGFTARRICSVYGQDLSECEHVRHRLYWVRGMRRSDGTCRVCMKESCRHRADRLYPAHVVSIVRNVTKMREVSLVRRPVNPEARLTELPVIPTADFAKKFGPEFKPGMPVSCDRCLGECDGFDELPEGDEWLSEPSDAA